MFEEFKAYVTKDAMEGRVYEVIAKWNPENPKWISYTADGFQQCAHGKDWHRTLEEAQARFERIKELRIAFLKRSAEQLSGLKMELIPC